jgi:polysaccharide biosynthesis protein PslG
MPASSVLWAMWCVILLGEFGALARAASHPFIAGIEASIRDGKATFPAIGAIGAQSIRLDVPWKLVERSPGRYQIPQWVEETVDSADAAHIEPLLILAYGNPLYGGDKPSTVAAIEAFGRYATFVVSHFQGRVRYFELWNEWETHTGGTTPGSPEGYVRLAEYVYPRIKGANPNAIVLAGGFADLRSTEVGNWWVGRFLALGGLRDADAISLHPYPQPRDDQSPEAAIQRVDTIYAMAEKQVHGRPVNIYITEMGYPTYRGRLGVSEKEAAQYVARFMLLAAARPYIRGVWWYGLRDQGVNPNNRDHHYGLFTADFQPKRAAEMFSAITELLRAYTVEGASRSRAGYKVQLRGSMGEHTVEWSGDGVMISDGKAALNQRPLLDLGTIRLQP